MIKEKTFFKIWIAWAVICLSLMGFGVWVIIKLLQHWSII